jgi:hypothetical protein
MSVEDMPTPSEYHVLSQNSDPSALTTAQLLRSIATLKELMLTLFTGQENVMREKFASFDTQLGLIERQRVEQKEDTKTAVDAALQAQKEAVREQTTASERAIAKSESAVTKQLDQQTITVNTAFTGVGDGMNDLKDRVSKVENVAAGARLATRDYKEGDAAKINQGQLIVAAVGIVIIIFQFILR